MIRKNLKKMVLVLAGVCMLSGTATVWADTPDGLWEYSVTTQSDSSLACDFKEVEVLLPASWTGKTGMKVSDDHVTFYHLASRQAHLDNDGTEGGVLFTLCYSQDYSFMNTLPNYSIIGSGAQGIYYMTLPTDVQGYTQDEETWSEWQSICEELDWVKEHITMTNPGEGIVTSNDIASSVSGITTNGYILPESSSRTLSASELQGMTVDQLQMAINEIYARNHRKFATPSIQAYFDSQSWYSGTVEPSRFDASSMSETEWANISLMLQCMNTASGAGSSTASSASSGSNDTAGDPDAIEIIGGSDGATSVQVADTPDVPIVEVSASGSNVRYANAGVNVRAQAQSGSEIVAVVLEGVGVAVTGETVNGWVPVNCNGITGYIYQDYLE